MWVASLQRGNVVAFDASASAWLSRSEITFKSTVFKRSLLPVNALGIVPLTFKDIACATVVDPLPIRIADTKLILLSYCEPAPNEVIYE